MALIISDYHFIPSLSTRTHARTHARAHTHTDTHTHIHTNAPNTHIYTQTTHTQTSKQTKTKKLIYPSIDAKSEWIFLVQYLHQKTEWYFSNNFEKEKKCLSYLIFQHHINLISHWGNKNSKNAWSSKTISEGETCVYKVDETVTPKLQALVYDTKVPESDARSV